MDIFLLFVALLACCVGGLMVYLYLQKEIAVFQNAAQNTTSQVQTLQETLQQKERVIIDLNKEVAAIETQNINLEEKLQTQKQEIQQLHQQLQLQFENIANRLLEEKSQRFTAQNQQQIGQILSPLQERIKDFETTMQQRFTEETKERASLKTEIAQLQQLNTQLSTDANNLVNALRGDNKTQGNWGELQLETLLERAGLQKGIHFDTQKTLFDGENNQKRPDFIIQLPEDKQLVLDSKVSLVAYERYFSENDPIRKNQSLKEHCQSLRQHIKELGAKNYPNLYGIQTPDYVLLFVPIEPALSLALQHDPNLFNEALDRNIVLVSTSTLLATLRTVSFIWKQERQKQNVLEIARQSGLLYDKFVAFAEDLKEIGTRLNSAQKAYQSAFNKLSDSTRKGDTLVGRAEHIRLLGAKTNKQLPKDLSENE